jgi:hypothetical protein
MKPTVGLKKLPGAPLLEVRIISAPWPRLAESSTNEVWGNPANQANNLNLFADVVRKSDSFYQTMRDRSL